MPTAIPGRGQGALPRAPRRASTSVARCDPFTLLLSSDTLTELVSRIALLHAHRRGRQSVVADLNVAAADARYQQTVLADLQAQDRTLKQAQDERIAHSTAYSPSRRRSSRS